MKHLLFSLLTIALLTPAIAAEKPKKKKRKRQPPVISATIHKDHSVTFRIKANNAKRVEVGGEFTKKRIPLIKGTNSIWSVKTDPIEPGLYGYSFYVDGLQTLDPGNPQLKPMRAPKTSILHLPGNNLWDFNPEIPHGTVHYHSYHSNPINRFRELQVYTPPGYENTRQKYPLLILQHGHSDTFATWTTHGKAHWILDNLIAGNKAVPMIIVMLDGHPIPSSFGNGRSINNTEELRLDLMETVLPMIEKKYRVKSGPENRAIAGLSMGGGTPSPSASPTPVNSTGSAPSAQPSPRIPTLRTHLRNLPASKISNSSGSPSVKKTSSSKKTKTSSLG
ncbi:MAG: hypothetical protein CMO80_19670 [Verrucomicrobiales bacterium]|nr:hypothetical protein [Verrucomicrobiales bacterium]